MVAWKKRLVRRLSVKRTKSELRRSFLGCVRVSGNPLFPRGSFHGGGDRAGWRRAKVAGVVLRRAKRAARSSP